METLEEDVVDLIYVMFVEVYGRLVAGDTVMRGLEKDEMRRYGTRSRAET